MRWRIPFAAFVVIAGLVLYAALVATASEWVPGHWAIEALFYAFAGVLWVYPAARLIAWSGRDQRPRWPAS